MTDVCFARQPSPEIIEERLAGFGSWFEIDLDRPTANLEAIRTYTGAEVMPVVKNDAISQDLWYYQQRRNDIAQPPAV